MLNRLLTITVIFYSVITCSLATTIRVKPNTDPNDLHFGESWATATNLQRALALAAPGDQIWIESGTFYPDEGQGQIDGSTDATFSIPEGVSLFGGFSGTETLFTQRDLTPNNHSILSGDIDKDDSLLAGQAKWQNITGLNSDTILKIEGDTASHTIDGFTITGADSTAIDVGSSSPKISRCLLEGNGNTNFLSFSSIVNTEGGSPLFTNCLFAENGISSFGSLINLTGNESSHFFGCAFFLNSQASSAGRYLIEYEDNEPVFINCNFIDNTITSRYLVDGSFNGGNSTFINCILDGNRRDNADESIIPASPSAEFQNCILPGSTSGGIWRSEFGTDLGANIDANPFLIPGEMALSSGSPAIDSGLNTAHDLPDLGDFDRDGDTQETIPVDYFGNTRITNSTIDIGASELMGPRATNVPSLSFQLTSTTLSETIDLKELFNGSALSFTIERITHPTIVSASLDPDTMELLVEANRDRIGSGFIEVSATDSTDISSLLIIDFEVTVDRIFVDENASGHSSGLSWENAFTTLQDALAVASPGSEIWVASGTFYPDEGQGQIDGATDATFSIPEGVSLFGGFSGTETLSTQRNLTPNNHSVLSGDIDKDDSLLAGQAKWRNITGLNSDTILKIEGDTASPIIDGFTITGAEFTAIDVGNSSPQISRCLLEGNGSSNSRGFSSIVDTADGSPHFTNCFFAENGISSNSVVDLTGDESSISIGCAFFSNSPTSSPSTLGNIVESDSNPPVFINCNFVDNTIGSLYLVEGFRFRGPATFVNCILNGNRRINTDESIIPALPGAEFQNCILQGATSGGIWRSEYGTDLGANIDANAALIPGEMALSSGSPAIDSGLNTAHDFPDLGDFDQDGDTQEAIPVDYFGNTRITNSTIDIGASEFTGGPRATNAPSLSFQLTSPPSSEAIDLRELFNGSAVSFVVEQITPTTVVSVSLDPDTMELLVEAAPGRTGSGFIEISATDSAGISAPLIIDFAIKIDRIFVDENASGQSSGLSWENAFTTLQDALALAIPGSEIWVASGTYYPDEGSDQSPNDRFASFAIPSGVTLYGSFEGDETTLAERNLQSVPSSVLSGDISQDDIDAAEGEPQFQAANIQGDNNSFTVVTTLEEADPDVISRILDGFVITAGDASGPSEQENGGGILTTNGNLIISNCSISGNRASGKGGGMFISNSGGGFIRDGSFRNAPSVVLSKCIISFNSANQGGGLSTESILVYDSDISNNLAQESGGGVEFTANAIFARCTISENKANRGEGVTDLVFHTLFSANVPSHKTKQRRAAVFSLAIQMELRPETLERLLQKTRFLNVISVLLEEH